MICWVLLQLAEEYFVPDGRSSEAGNYPDATAVFDVDAIGLVKIVRSLNYGLDIGKNSIGESTGFTIAVAATRECGYRAGDTEVCA